MNGLDPLMAPSNRIRCLACGAEPGEVCRTRTGRRRRNGKPHELRSTVASILHVAVLTTIFQRPGTVLILRQAAHEALNQLFANACREALGRPIEPSSIREVIS